MSQERKVIVKIKRTPLVTGTTAQCLVQSEDRSIQFSGNLPPSILNQLGGRMVIYAEATISAQGVIGIGDIVPDCNW
jgi:hypothetical protein